MQARFEYLEDSELIMVNLDIYHDERGELSEIYNMNQFHEFGICDEFIHEVESISKFNVIRGFHYQSRKNALSKLIRVLEGCFQCVFLDIRHSSDTYGKVYSYVLSDKRQMIYVPIGYALAIQSLYDVNYFIYKMSNTFVSEESRAINTQIGVDDLDLNNIFTRYIDSGNVILSEKDMNAPIWNDYCKDPEY